MKVSVIGCGAWGTALAKILSQNSHDVLAWAYEEKTVKDINNDHVNHDFLPGILLPNNFKASGDINEVFNFSKIWVSALPSQQVRGFFEKAHLPKSKIIFVSATKGIEIKTHKLMHEVFEEVLPSSYQTCFLSGPSFAKEAAMEQPTLVTIAGKHEKALDEVCELFKNNYFKPYKGDDVIGIEVAGALKNVVAIASGIAEGCGFRINAQAALLTRALREISLLGIALGARSETFMGLSGMGDLILTCLGELSRNKQLGIEVGKGISASQLVSSQRTVAEGYYTAKAAMKLIQDLNLDLPILTTTYEVLYENKRPMDALSFLMLRPTKWE